MLRTELFPTDEVAVLSSVDSLGHWVATVLSGMCEQGPYIQLFTQKAIAFNGFKHEKAKARLW